MIQSIQSFWLFGFQWILSLSRCYSLWRVCKKNKKWCFCTWRTKCCTMAQPDWQLKRQRETKIPLGNSLIRTSPVTRERHWEEKKKKKTEQIWIGRGSCFSVKCIIMPKTTTRISGRVTLAKLFLKLQMEDKSRVGATEIGSRTISNGPNKSQFRPIQSNHWVDRRRPKGKQAPKILRARLRAPLGFNNITYAFMEWKKQIQSRGEQMAAAAAFSRAMRHCGDDD